MSLIFRKFQKELSNVEVCWYTIYCMAGTLMSLSWMPVLVNSVVKTSGWLVITMSPAKKTDFETNCKVLQQRDPVSHFGHRAPTNRRRAVAELFRHPVSTKTKTNIAFFAVFFHFVLVLRSFHIICHISLSALAYLST